MYQHVVVTAKVVSEPLDENGRVFFFGEVSRPSSNGTESHPGLVRVFIGNEKAREQTLAKIHVGNHVQVLGRIVGTPQGSPMIQEDENGPWTAIDMVSYTPLLLNKVASDDREDSIAVVLDGHLGGDPGDIGFTKSGTAVINFNIATNHVYTDGATKKKSVTWWTISVWGNQTDIAKKYLKKGMKVLVEGSPELDPKTGGWQLFERKDGTLGAKFTLRANTFRFSEPKQAESVNESASTYDAPAPDDDAPMPF